MDGISSLYGSAYQQATSYTNTELDSTLGTDYSSASDDELMSACKSFESYFVQQMYEALQKTIPESEEDGDSYSSSIGEYAKTLLTQTISESTSNQNDGIGIAKMLYEQMKRNYDL